MIISHRANLHGPKPSEENSPPNVRAVLELGLDCEIDLWRKDGKLYLGHDEPFYSISFNFLSQSGLWIHCKNLDALEYLRLHSPELNLFWHQSDDYTLTSRGIIWTFPGKSPPKDGVIVHLDKDWRNFNYPCAVCTDYPLWKL